MSSQQPNSSQGNLPENTDCYYYYYSNCTKRDTCPYRHEPLALNQEKVCTFWLQGTCAKPHCMFRYVTSIWGRDICLSHLSFCIDFEKFFWWSNSLRKSLIKNYKNFKNSDASRIMKTTRTRKYKFEEVRTWASLLVFR